MDAQVDAASAQIVARRRRRIQRDFCISQIVRVSFSQFYRTNVLIGSFTDCTRSPWASTQGRAAARPLLLDWSFVD
jgi:hypothetical protein